MNIPSRIILSRPDAIGDAVVTLTTAGWIKHHAPSMHITVIARRYALPVWRHSMHADALLVLEDLQESGEAQAIARIKAVEADAIVHVFPHREVARWAKAAGVPRRIGTSHRWWHWITCNERVNFSRKSSLLHEAQLNIKLLEPFGVPAPATVNELVPHLGFRVPAPAPEVSALLMPDRKHLVVHPLLGSGVGWGLENFAMLIRSTDPQSWQVLVTGTKAEAERYGSALPLDLPNVTDTGGRLDLEGMIQLIGASDAFVSASTGPLHIAAACDVKAIGLFSMRPPIFPSRWAPIGRDAHALVFDPGCEDCAAGRPCGCIARIAPAQVLALLQG